MAGRKKGGKSKVRSVLKKVISDAKKKAKVKDKKQPRHDNKVKRRNGSIKEFFMSSKDNPIVIEDSPEPPTTQHALDKTVIDLTEPQEEDITQQMDGQTVRTLRQKECEICMESKAVTQYPIMPHIGADEHARTACFKCWRDHIKTMLADSLDNIITCIGCEQELAHSDLKKLATKKVFHEWMDRAAKSCMSKDEEYVACPSGECPWGCFMDAKDQYSIFSCQMCQVKYCMQCEVPMHEGMSCEEHKAAVRQREADEANSNNVIDATTKPCPSCKSRIEKSDGCDHMTCRRCGHEFCWLCFAAYRGQHGVFRVGNTAHTAECRYHSRRIDYGH